MSIGRILLGIGGLGVTVAGIWFGLDRKKEDDRYQLKMTKFRATAQRANTDLVSQRWPERLLDPEHKIWSGKFNSYSSQKWTGNSLNLMPPESRGF